MSSVTDAHREFLTNLGWTWNEAAAAWWPPKDRPKQLLRTQEALDAAGWGRRPALERWLALEPDQRRRTVEWLRGWEIEAKIVADLAEELGRADIVKVLRDNAERMEAQASAAAKLCPKCSAAARPAERVPGWSCPACGALFQARP